ncbi:amidohydrolase family protein [Sulfurimonas aquatica]|uniref:Amidohydrolase family protein n=1 Tax=Sulfurimonas aquatica TaxID=2672570 RepID=A0A975B0I3_9BACT|nr:amidohydrolase family protein [Sulfurimonas aquatica]QSZ41987.1 amidohydrolase family protein [Sulfurimonas aquatica]
MVISNAVVCDVNGEKEVDVLIENGLITKIGHNLESDEILDAKGAYLLPSLVDTNVRVLDSQLNAKNILAISEEAKHGGVGHIILNADSTPAIDNEVVLEFAQHGISGVDGVKIDLMLNALKEDMTLSNIAILLKKGVVAPFMSTIAKNNIAIKIAEYAKMYDVTIFCKAEDNSLINAGVMLDGDVSSKLGLAGIPELSEVLHVSRMIEIAKYFDIKILFKAIASPRSVELIAKAKKEGVKVSCEVSIHHIINSDEACEGFNTMAKLDPPLACHEDMLKLQEALKNGDIDILTTLHQPSSPVNKEVAFYDAAYGCTGLAYALPLYYTKLVKSGLISMSELLQMTSRNPAQSIKLLAGSIEVGQKADLILFDTKVSEVLKDIGSLYNNQELSGLVSRVNVTI